MSAQDAAEDTPAEEGKKSPDMSTEPQAALEDDIVSQKIAFVASSRNPFLNISEMKVKVLPESLLGLTHLQFLYMAFNGLTELPNETFSALPNLKWLDLRGNRLGSLPTLDLSSHAFLEYLLLEDNCISHLPIELGYIRSLRGLALSGNPLDFPHAEVLSGGAAAVKAYLREVHSGRLDIENRLAAEQQREEDEDDDENYSSQLQQDSEDLSVGDNGIPDVDAAAGPLPLSRDATGLGLVARQPLKSHQQQQQQSLSMTTQTAQIHRQQAPQIRQRVAPVPAPFPARASERHNQLVRRYPEPPGPGLAERRAAEERRNARRRDTLARQEAVLQRRRDAEATRAWRDEARQLQARAPRVPRAVAAHNSDERIRGAPFNSGWEESALALPTHADLARRRQEEGAKGVARDPRPEPMSPEAQARAEAERRRAEAEASRRVRAHAEELMERRRMAGQQGLTATQAVEAARRDVEIAMEMQRELALRRAQFENRTLALQNGGAGGRQQRLARK